MVSPKTEWKQINIPLKPVKNAQLVDPRVIHKCPVETSEVISESVVMVGQDISLESPNE